MFVRNREEIFADKNICFQNDVHCDNRDSKVEEGLKTWAPVNSHNRRCYCQKVARDLFYLEWFALPIAFLISLFAIVWLVYLNRCIKYELMEVNKKLLLLQENQDFFQESFSELMRAQNHINAHMQEYSFDEVSSMDESMISETSGDEFENNSSDMYKLLRQFVGWFNVTDNLDSNGTLKNFGNITAFQDELNDKIHELKTSLEFCNLLRSLNLPDFSGLVMQCDELDKQRKRTKRSNPRGPVASHFKGAIPEMFIQDTGLVAPWFPDPTASADFSLDFEFREGRGTVEVTEEGLYMIYAQVYYLTTEILNSFTINVREKDQEGKPVAYCNSNAVVPKGGVTEVSCFTAVIRYLNATNQIYLNQRDRNRRMILREGHSFLGIIRLNTAPDQKRRRPNRQ